MNCNARVTAKLGVIILIFSAVAWCQSANQDSQSGASPEASSTGAQRQAGVPSTSPHDASYVIGNDDVLAINVWKEQELSRTIPVRSDGKISLPLVGEIVAAGKTPLQLEQLITDKLKAYITDPEVTVIVEKINSKKYNILGEVGKPGVYPLTLTTTIMDAIAAAGGFRDFAKKTHVYILRPNANGTQTRLNFNYKDFIKGKNLDQNVTIESGDTIIVP